MNTIDSSGSELLNTAFLRWFQELTDRGIFTTDATLTIRTWNRWLEMNTGIAAERAAGRSLFDICPTLVERGLDRHYRDALNGEVKVLSERLHKYLIPVSQTVHAASPADMAQSARIAPLLLDGAVAGTVTVIDDVTGRGVCERELRSLMAASAQARAAAEEALRLKDEFLATLSHEFRTPLNAVLGWTQILRRQPSIKWRNRALEVIERNASWQLRLIDDLLDVARASRGGLQLDVKVVRLDRVARAAIAVMMPAARAKLITIATAFESNVPPVNGDAERLQQAVWNLISNAVKFTDMKGRVDVQIRRDADAIALSVRDTGQGIPRDFLPYVFDRFRQADASARRRHGGLGLGLALVRQIVELHGGTVSVTSPGPSEGTTFEIRLASATPAPRKRRNGKVRGRPARSPHGAASRP